MWISSSNRLHFYKMTLQSTRLQKDKGKSIFSCKHACIWSRAEANTVAILYTRSSPSRRHRSELLLPMDFISISSELNEERFGLEWNLNENYSMRKNGNRCECCKRKIGNYHGNQVWDECRRYGAKACKLSVWLAEQVRDSPACSFEMSNEWPRRL